MYLCVSDNNFASFYYFTILITDKGESSAVIRRWTDNTMDKRKKKPKGQTMRY
jgi:hypothetical protein